MPRLTANAMIRADPETYEAYQERRAGIVVRFDALGWGTRSRCARELKLSPSAVSSVLIGGRISVVTLDLLEEWLDLVEE